MILVSCALPGPGSSQLTKITRVWGSGYGRDVPDLVLLPWDDDLDGATEGLDVVVWTDDGPEPPQDVLDDVVLYVPAYLTGVPGVRSAVWVGSWVGLAMMLAPFLR